MRHQPIFVAEHEPATGRSWTARRFFRLLALIWLVSATLLIVVQARSIAHRNFPDPDDYLRLGEVRAWLAGQSFWDVSQHRVDVPVGGPMHWSRIVDAPIALFELLLRPLLGVQGAETATTIAVPLLTMAVVMFTVAALGRRLAGAATGLAAAALLPTAIVSMVQLKPLRVDHHGWEIAFSVLALAALLIDRRAIGGMLAGAAIAVGLQISLEQLPFAVALGALVAGHWLIDPRPAQAARLLAFATALAAIETLLFLVLRAPAGWTAYCDAVSPPHLLALAIVAAGIAACVVAAPAAAPMRAAGLALTAGIAAAAFHSIPPHCWLDPFATLDPLAKLLWLDNVPEGLPIWRSGFQTTIFATGFPVIGLIAAGFAARASHGERRVLWLSYGAVLAAATLLGILVLRAASLSNALATVPAAWAMVLIVRRTTNSASALVRVLGTVAAILALGPLAPGVFALSLPIADKPDDPKVAKDREACQNSATWRFLNALPPARMMASIDLGPAILLNTRHAVLATGHHRNSATIAEELRAWTGDDARARQTVRTHELGYLLICPTMGETDVYAKYAPRGLSARLLTGRTPAWLGEVPVPGSTIRLWRVLPQPPAGLPSSRSAGGAVPTVSQISRKADFSPSS